MFKKLIFNIPGALRLIMDENRRAVVQLFRIVCGKEFKMVKKLTLIFISIGLLGLVSNLSAVEEPFKAPAAQEQVQKQEAEGRETARLEALERRELRRRNMPRNRLGGQGRGGAFGTEFDGHLERLIDAYRENDREKIGQAIRQIRQLRQRIQEGRRIAGRGQRRFGGAYGQRGMGAMRSRGFAGKRGPTGYFQRPQRGMVGRGRQQFKGMRRRRADMRWQGFGGGRRRFGAGAWGHRRRAERFQGFSRQKGPAIGGWGQGQFRQRGMGRGRYRDSGRPQRRSDYGDMDRWFWEEKPMRGFRR